MLVSQIMTSKFNQTMLTNDEGGNLHQERNRVYGHLDDQVQLAPLERRIVSSTGPRIIFVWLAIEVFAHPSIQC